MSWELDKVLHCFYLKKNYLCLIGGQFLYNTVLVSVIYQHKLAIDTEARINNGEKAVSSISDVGKTGQQHVEEWN